MSVFCSLSFYHWRTNSRIFSSVVCVWMLFFKEQTLTCTHSFLFVLQGFWWRAVWSHRGKGFLHREGREHINQTGPRCCQLPAQDGHCAQRPEGRQHTHTHTHTLIGSRSIWFTAVITPRFDTGIMFLGQSWAGCVFGGWGLLKSHPINQSVHKKEEKKYHFMMFLTSLMLRFALSE